MTSEPQAINLTTITPCVSSNVSSSKLLSWIEYNFISVCQFTKGRYQSLYALRNPSAVFSKENRNIIMAHTVASLPIQRPQFRPQNVTVFNSEKLYIPIEIRQEGPHLTQLPKIACEKLTTVPLSKVLGPSFYSSASKRMYDAVGTGAGKRQVSDLLSQSITADTVASFSFLEELVPAIKAEIASSLPQTLMGIKPSNLFRGNKSISWRITKVTKEEVITGKAIFLFSHDVNSIKYTSTTTTDTHLSLGTFLSPIKVIKYQKSRIGFASFLKTLSENPKKIFFPKEYLAEVAKKLKGFTKFWGGIGDILKPSEIPTDFVLPDFDVVKQTLESGTHISNKVYHSLDIATKLKHTEEALVKDRCENAVNENRDRITEAHETLNAIKALKGDFQNKRFSLNLIIREVKKEILSYQTLLKVCEEKSQVNKLDNENAQAQLARLNLAQNRMATFFQSAVDAYNSKAQAYLLEKTNNKDHFTNLLNSGILVKAITIRNTRTGESKDLVGSLNEIGNPEWRFFKVLFLTTKPIPIYVDRATYGDKAKIVYGGPYEVLITTNADGKPNMAIRLASLNSVFGFKTRGSIFRAKPHPHTGSVVVYPEIQSLIHFIEDYRTTCLGDTESTIQQAFKQQNVKMVIAGAMSWLTSCHTIDRDEWGVEYDWFPTADQVDPTGNWTPTTLPIQDTLKQMQNNLSQTQNP